MSETLGLLIVTNSISFTLGIGFGGYAGYKLVMRKIENSVSSMFGGFNNAGELIDNMAEMEEE